MFAAASNKIESLSVIDPCNRTGKITVPMAFVSETKGVSDFIKCGGVPPPDTKDLSLCLLFQKGRCNAGARCNQVHAAPEFIEQLRTRVRTSRTCCARHGDANSADLDLTRSVAVHAENGVKYYTLGDFGRTPSLDTAMGRARTATVRVQAGRICRLHQRGGCKFGRDCKNIHLCPDAVPTNAGGFVDVPTLAPPMPAHAAPLARVAPAHVAVPSAGAEPPSLGFAFRGVGINDRCSAAMLCASGVDVSAATSGFAPSSADASGSDFADHVPTTRAATVASVNPMSVLSFLDHEFNSMRAEPDDADPLDIVDDGSSCSSGNDFAHDFGAFVDALVQCGDTNPMASPQWLMHPIAASE